jgi:hypothetical protein
MAFNTTYFCAGTLVDDIAPAVEQGGRSVTARFYVHLTGGTTIDEVMPTRGDLCSAPFPAGYRVESAQAEPMMLGVHTVTIRAHQNLDRIVTRKNFDDLSRKYVVNGFTEEILITPEMVALQVRTKKGETTATASTQVVLAVAKAPPQYTTIEGTDGKQLAESAWVEFTPANCPFKIRPAGRFVDHVAICRGYELICYTRGPINKITQFSGQSGVIPSSFGLGELTKKEWRAAGHQVREMLDEQGHKFYEITRRIIEIPRNIVTQANTSHHPDLLWSESMYRNGPKLTWDW